MAVAWTCLLGWFQSAGRHRATRHEFVVHVAALLVGEVSSVCCDELTLFPFVALGQASQTKSMPSGADRAALLFRVFGQEARFSGGLTGVSI
jgi:hypothetical protein